MADDLTAILAGIRADLSDGAAYPHRVMEIHAPRLLAAIEALTGALERHQQWFKDERGVKICGGCLEPVPCKDTDVIGRALAGKDSSDE